MANKSDEIVKRELLDIGDVGNLKLRVFPGGSHEDQQHWTDGGLCFGDGRLVYGSCDGAWYADKKWRDPLSGKESPQTPVLAVEGTLALERGSGGNAQYQRFFHALGAVLSGVTGVYYLRKGKDSLRYDLPQAALNASAAHGVDYFVITDINDLHRLVNSRAKNNYDAVAAGIKEEMKARFAQTLNDKFKGDIEQYFASRSIIRLPGCNIKYLAGSYRNFTEGSQRAGQVILGEFLMAKYMLQDPFYFLLPRLLPDEVGLLDASSKKEWSVLRADEMGRLITLDDLEGVSQRLKKSILALKAKPLGGSKKGGAAAVKWRNLMKRMVSSIRKGAIKVKQP